MCELKKFCFSFGDNWFADRILLKFSFYKLPVCTYGGVIWNFLKGYFLGFNIYYKFILRAIFSIKVGGRLLGRVSETCRKLALNRIK